MATMLGFVATDAVIAPALLQRLVREAADESFNRITIDGDTSTNDSFVLIATHRAGNARHRRSTAATAGCCATRCSRCRAQLAQAIVRDGEGATKFITVRVEGGRDVAECRQVAYAIAHSPLVKTAFFASDPNLGRILAAVGYAGIDDLDQTPIDLFLDDVHVAAARRPAPELPRGRRPARDEAERDHGARRPAPRRRRGDGLDLRPVATTTSRSTPTTAPDRAALACGASVGAPQRKRVLLGAAQRRCYDAASIESPHTHEHAPATRIARSASALRWPLALGWRVAVALRPIGRRPASPHLAPLSSFDRSPLRDQRKKPIDFRSFASGPPARPAPPRERAAKEERGG